MASSAEQPLKKRKLYDPPPEPASLPQPASFVPSAPPTPPQPPPPPSQEEILRKRRNREEIRNLYECYRRINYCVAQKDPRLMPDFEQAYLALITASRGCTSVQRIVAELIPRYALYCPTALEAAAKVSINMYNWSLAIMMRGEDADGVAYQTAKACIFGLVDICCTASYEAPTSSVIRGICSAVFRNVLTFFTPTFEGMDIYQVGCREILKLQGSRELFSVLKQEVADDGESTLHKLLNFRALCLLRIFFSFPKDLLAACFELLDPNGTEALPHKGGQYFLSQVTAHLNVEEVSHALDRSVNGDLLCMDPNHTCTNCKQMSNVNSSLDDNGSPKNSSRSANNCFMGMVIEKDASLRRWIISTYKNLCKSLDSKDASSISSFLENKIGFLMELEQEADCYESEEDNFDPAKYIDNQYSVHNISIRHNRDAHVTAGDHPLGVSDTCSNAQMDNKNAAENFVEENVKPCWKLLPNDANIRSVNGSYCHHGEEPFLMNQSETRDYEGIRQEKTSSTKVVINNQLASTVSVKQSDLKSDARGESLGGKVENLASNSDPGIPANRSSGSLASMLSSPKQNLSTQYQASSNQIFWYVDGDPAAMDVFPASKQLWLGSLGHDASETLVRLQFENFGPLEKINFFPSKSFALAEYRNIMDAVRARECMQGSSQWGGCLDIKFLDAGLGCRGIVNGVAIGECCHVYIGKVATKWAKDEILNDLMNRGLRSPHMITDLMSESALLLEFGTAEEAAIAMSHIRKRRAYSKDKFRNSEVRVYHNEEQRTPRVSNSPGYFPSHGDLFPSGLENKPGNRYAGSYTSKPDNISDLVSPRVKPELGTRVQNAQAFQSNWGVTSSAERLEAGAQRADGFESKMASGPSFAAGPSTSFAGEHIWPYKKHDMEPLLSARSSQPMYPIVTHGASSLNPPTQTSFVHPNYLTQNSPWNTCAPNPPLPLYHQVSTSMMPGDNRHISAFPTLPFIPSSVTPLSQLQGRSVRHFDQTVTAPPPLVPDVRPPLPSSPPPLPLSQPPSIPPPPSSPPPLLQNAQNSKSCLHYQWEGTLSKSGIHYCTIYAIREDSNVCKYSNAVSEPADWPARLDVTKRTDFRHAKTTFTSTPSHKREVCRLLPSTTSDHKGFHDFMSYLRQRECAGVIKIPAGKAMWARLLFILPYSLDTCSLLGIVPHPAECLIALILPKETNSE